MKISRIVEFLEGVKERDGDIDVQTITGFWVRTIPSTGERVVVCAVGDGKSIEEDINERIEYGIKHPPVLHGDAGARGEGLGQ